jgi:hypothetical protein
VSFLPIALKPLDRALCPLSSRVNSLCFVIVLLVYKALFFETQDQIQAFVPLKGLVLFLHAINYFALLNLSTLYFFISDSIFS